MGRKFVIVVKGGGDRSRPSDYFFASSQSAALPSVFSSQPSFFGGASKREDDEPDEVEEDAAGWAFSEGFEWDEDVEEGLLLLVGEAPTVAAYCSRIDRCLSVRELVGGQRRCIQCQQ